MLLLPEVAGTCLISDEGVHSMLLFNLHNAQQCGNVRSIQRSRDVETALHEALLLIWATHPEARTVSCLRLHVLLDTAAFELLHWKEAAMPDP